MMHVSGIKDKKSTSHRSHDHEEDDDDVDAASQNTSKNEAEVDQEDANEQFPNRSTNVVGKLRFFFLAALLASMSTVGALTYIYTSNSEQAQFEQQFSEDASKVLQAIGESLHRNLEGFDALAVSLVSHVRATAQTWPFVSIPDFVVRAEKIRSLTSALYISLNPLVTTEQRAEWEAFGAEHGRDWVEETFDLQEEEGLFVDAFESNNLSKATVHYLDHIWNYDAYYADPPKEDGIPLSGTLPKLHALSMKLLSIASSHFVPLA